MALDFSQAMEMILAVARGAESEIGAEATLDALKVVLGDYQLKLEKKLNPNGLCTYVSLNEDPPAPCKLKEGHKLPHDCSPATTFEQALAAFMEANQKRIDAHEMKTYPNLVEQGLGTTLEYEIGKKYIKVIRNSGGSRSAHCFIDKTTGDILKAASWKAPAKHKRGNIYESPTNGVGVYGADYLK